MQTVCGSGKALTATARRTGKIENFISFTANERISWYVCIVGRGKRTRQTDGGGRIVIRGKSWVLLSALKHRLVKSLPKRQANVDFPFHLSLPRSDCANDRHPTCSPVSGLLTSNGPVEVSNCDSRMTTSISPSVASPLNYPMLENMTQFHSFPGYLDS